MIGKCHICISLNQFYGIEKSNYAVETTKLSLWLKHQMNLMFKKFWKYKTLITTERNWKNTL